MYKIYKPIEDRLVNTRDAKEHIDFSKTGFKLRIVPMQVGVENADLYFQLINRDGECTPLLKALSLNPELPVHEAVKESVCTIATFEENATPEYIVVDLTSGQMSGAVDITKSGHLVSKKDKIQYLDEDLNVTTTSNELIGYLDDRKIDTKDSLLKQINSGVIFKDKKGRYGVLANNTSIIGEGQTLCAPIFDNPNISVRFIQDEQGKNSHQVIEYFNDTKRAMIDIESGAVMQQVANDGQFDYGESLDKYILNHPVTQAKMEKLEEPADEPVIDENSSFMDKFRARAKRLQQRAVDACNEIKVNMQRKRAEQIVSTKAPWVVMTNSETIDKEREL